MNHGRKGANLSLPSVTERKDSVFEVFCTIDPPPSYRHAVYLKEGESCRWCIRVKAVRQLVQVIRWLRLHLDHLRPRGDVLAQRSLVASGEEGHCLVQLIKQGDVNAAEASVEGRSLVCGWHVHQVRSLGLVVQVVHSGYQTCAHVHLKLMIWPRHKSIGDSATVTWAGREGSFRINYKFKPLTHRVALGSERKNGYNIPHTVDRRHLTIKLFCTTMICPLDDNHNQEQHVKCHSKVATLDPNTGFLLKGPWRAVVEWMEQTSATTHVPCQLVVSTSQQSGQTLFQFQSCLVNTLTAPPALECS